MSGHMDSPPPMEEQMLYLLNENRRLQATLDRVRALDGGIP